MKKVIVIVGPTAVGKSDFAIELAKKLNGEIISGDSIQVYQGLDIGSGKVTQEEMDGVPHHLIDIYTTKQSYTVADFQLKARELINQSEKPMIIVVVPDFTLKHAYMIISLVTKVVQVLI